MIKATSWKHPATNSICPGTTQLHSHLLSVWIQLASIRSFENISAVSCELSREARRHRNNHIWTLACSMVGLLWSLSQDLIHFAVGTWEKISEIWQTQLKIVHKPYLSYYFQRETPESYFLFIYNCTTFHVPLIGNLICFLKNPV